MRLRRPPLLHGKKSRLARTAEAWHEAEHLNLPAHVRDAFDREDQREKLKTLQRQIMIEDAILVRESELEHAP